MTEEQQKKAARLIHKMSEQVQNSHNGWWESYATQIELEFVALSKELRRRTAKKDRRKYKNGISRS